MPASPPRSLTKPSMPQPSAPKPSTLTPTSRPRGRPRSLDAQQAVLRAAFALAARDSLKSATIDAIARESGVSKMTIYKWWPSRLSLLIDALLRQMSDQLPLDENADAPTQLRQHAQAYVGVLTSDLGRMQSAVIAECLAESGNTELFVERYLAHRRDLGLRLIRRGQRAQRILATADAGALYDQIYGTLLYRHLFGLPGLTKAFAATLVDSVLQPAQE